MNNKPIQRWDIDANDVTLCMSKNSLGDYVLYDDHVEALEARLVIAEKEAAALRLSVLQMNQRHEMLCRMLKDEMENDAPELIPPVAQTTTQEAVLIPTNWSVLNGDAEVAGGLTFVEAWDYLTPEVLARKWCAVCVVDEENQPIVQTKETKHE